MMSIEFALTPIGEALEQRRKDCDLIRSDAIQKDWKAVLNGIDYQIQAWKELRNDIRAATS